MLSSARTANKNIGSIISSNVDFTSPTVHNISADIEMLEQEVEDVTGFAENDKLTKNIEIFENPLMYYLFQQNILY